MSSLAHQVHIALSWPRTSRVQRGSNLGSCSTFPSSPLIPTIISLRVIDLVSSPVWSEAETNIVYSCWLSQTAAVTQSRLSYRVLGKTSIQDTCPPLLKSQGAVSQALTVFGRARFIAWRLRCTFLGEYRRGQRHFWKHLKKALCHTVPFGGGGDK